MPAAAVIPAPIAYTRVAAVKKLVVVPLGRRSAGISSRGPVAVGRPIRGLAFLPGVRSSGGGSPPFTVKKLECSKQAYAPEYISME